MKTYRIELIVDKAWLDTINNVTQDVWDGEVCTWVSIKEIKESKVVVEMDGVS